MIWEIDESTRGIEGLDDDGRPRPEYAASLGLVRAPFGRRALSATIEAVVYVLLQLPLLLGALPALLAASAEADPAEALQGRLVLVVVLTAISTVLTTVYLIVQLVLHGRRGITLGKALTGLRSVNVRTLERPGFWRGAVVRGLVLWASFAVPLLGPLLVIALSPFFDPERRGRGWADLAGATWLVDARRGLNPYDDKRMRIARKTVATDLADVRSELPSLATAAGPRPPAAYVPAPRSSGGVLGAARGEAASGIATPAPAPEHGAPAPATTPFDAPDPVAAPAGPTASGWVPPQLLPDGSAASPVREAPAVTGAQGGPAAPSRPGASAARFVLDTGRVVDVGSGILIGRDPAPVTGDDGVAPVAIDDPTMSVSKTHLAVLPHGTDTVVVDRGSTNGSAVVRGGAEHPLVPGAPVALRPGDTIRFGDRHAMIRIG
ncbi:RDD family protein [Microbacterium sp. NPDC055455]